MENKLPSLNIEVEGKVIATDRTGSRYASQNERGIN